MAQGRKDRPLVVKGNATSALSLPLVLNLPQLKHEFKTAQRDCVTVQRRAVLYADLPDLGPKQLPVEMRQRVYVPKLPKIEVADVDIPNLSLKKGEAVAQLRITKYEAIPFTVQ